MSDEGSPTGDRKSLTVQLRQRPLDEVVAALREFEREAQASAFAEGFKAGYEQAYKAVQEALVGGKTIAGISSVKNIEVKSSTIEVDDEDSNGKPLSATDRIVGLIETRPGLRGVEIVSALMETGTPVIERTVRTILWRLKNAGRITAVAGRWYTPQNVPPDLLSQEDED